ncbi:MAG: hypothetical protein ACN4G0_00360, partial [Polyangiales bacterium]
PIAPVVIREFGKNLMALTTVALIHLDEEQEHFIDVANGEKAPHGDLEDGWLRFVSEHPELRDE